MARRLFMKHLADANLADIAQLENVHSPDEGLVSCVYTYPPSAAPCRVGIQMCTTNIDEYPDGNSFMLYTDDEDINPVIPQTLQRVTENATGKTLPDILSEVSQRLTAAITRQIGEEEAASENGTDVSDDLNDLDADLEFYDSDDGEFGLAELSCNGERYGRGSSDTKSWSTQNREKVRKIREDLRALKNAGFRVGVFGDLAGSGVLCASIRTVKLGLSEEAMQAWGLRRKHYLVLMIKYCGSYIGADKLAEIPLARAPMKMRVGLCEHYKPSLHDESVFLDDMQAEDTSHQLGTNDNAPGLEPLFIGKALNQHLEERVFLIIKARISYGLSWLGAETLVADRQACSQSAPVDNLAKYRCDDKAWSRNLSDVALADHMHEVQLKHASLPLIMMQFVIRHFVRCTEFCLVCHCRLDDSFEALKPYVCSKPLCLYQFMSLGFGTSLEWEIFSQPYVVDLLISFCYTAASLDRLKDLPIGMGLIVPVVPRALAYPPGATSHSAARGQSSAPPLSSQGESSFACHWSPSLNSLMVEGDYQCTNVQKLKRGDWLVIMSTKSDLGAHCRVQHVALPQISLGEPVWADDTPATQSATQRIQNNNASLTSQPIKAICYVYDKQFEDLSKADQLHAVLTLLEALPSVGEMYQYLETQTKGRLGKTASLKAWSNRVPESSVNLLRWIVASNRSCIVPVDGVAGNIDLTASISKEPRVGEMCMWMQFRFAQGAPDKEKRFDDCVMAAVAQTKSTYPTIFAWHGSRLANWHSIVRQGLNYNELVHGRTFGNGVYLSPSAQVSLSYVGADGQPRDQWKRSLLKVSTAISLNEVVNNPDKFVSKTPHYVVSDTDWIQTRYLFVKVGAELKSVSGPATEIYKQDPLHVAHNDNNFPITIPMTAISKSRRPFESIRATSTTDGKRAKSIVGIDQATAERQEDDANSVVSDACDLAILRTDEFGDCMVDSGDDATTKEPETDFVPGTLDMSNIKFLEPPEDANITSTKALMRLLQEASDVQKKTPPAMLGWHIDYSGFNNMYQWIVELHSFPLTLPLAQDMKAAGLTSIVLEMRFSSQFPFVPPFLRVVKPRFLSFAQGGGGNVTEGGAMCMEVLTNNGWSAAQSIESLLLLVRMALLDEERPARLAKAGAGVSDTYGIAEAVEAYVRACRNHGWQVPAGFDKLHLA
ncbi:hypothetical protein A1O1_04858 [Capronia coronata CBS 617.96]|uniref:UBC core domain-containing protein n=1 Tax=Capronia coronata CBS 617.96 TaxID=1182541 RepID=W9YFB1_9EURO|nr:uncharacterized protein A1O1_04858 [Capronia coronata CBS 617.96]EXJ87931.1 hypothetical protein A1O1_04858 [Capronia coronata CBS 617.96]